jgi:hypothetical protein
MALNGSSKADASTHRWAFRGTGVVGVRSHQSRRPGPRAPAYGESLISLCGLDAPFAVRSRELGGAARGHAPRRIGVPQPAPLLRLLQGGNRVESSARAVSSDGRAPDF